MKNLFDKNFNSLSFFNKIKFIFKSLSVTEKTILFIFLIIILVSGNLTLNSVLEKFKIENPIEGGKFIHGTIGSPRFINPLLATSETDKSLTNLIYSGLMRNDNGQMIPDLADNLSISEDGLQYTFKINDKAKFHDGKPVTSDDVIFTINKAKDPELKSPKRSNWEGVRVEKIDDKNLKIILSQPFEPFIQNTSLGILPKHIWNDVSSSEFAFSVYNLNPIGSGPYKIKKVTRDQLGIPKNYALEANKNFLLKKPLIGEIDFKFAKNENELVNWYKNKKIDSFFGISPEKAIELEKSGFEIKSLTLPRIFGVFFNQNKPNVLSSNIVRTALNTAVNKEQIINKVLFGFGEKIDNPIPNNFKNNSQEISNNDNINSEQSIVDAQKILEKGGWKKNQENIYILENKDGKKILSFSIATNNVKELVDTANQIAEIWNKVGAKVDVKVYEQNDFTQNIIRQRNYDAILFGVAVTKVSDLYAFWHSSQRNDPGLNISGYTNIITDNILEKIKTIYDYHEIQDEIKKLETEIKKDVPAIAIYSPKLIYAVNNKIKTDDFKNINTSDEIFNHVYKWYIKTEKILKIFKNEES